MPGHLAGIHGFLHLAAKDVNGRVKPAMTKCEDQSPSGGLSKLSAPLASGLQLKCAPAIAARSFS